jgi:Ca2+-binding EF-hand superfamily protein
MAQQVAQLQQAAKMLPTAALQNSDTGLSQLAFDNLVAQFGGETGQAAELFQTFDANGDGSISNAEFEKGLNSALKNQNSAFEQGLFGLMDTDGNGSVSASEFTSFETAFLQGETPLPQSS